MGGVGVIDRFLQVFTSYIDSGFGLLGGDVAFLATTLIVIDVTLAALFWAWGADDDILARLIKKTLFVGVFAYIIGNRNARPHRFRKLRRARPHRFGRQPQPGELLQPGPHRRDRPWAAVNSHIDFRSDGLCPFFENFLQIIILLFAWLVVLLSFFILAIQLFVTLIEFKLATLAGFILVPFGLFNKTAFMAERVLGLVISSGVKVLVLAVIVGIGSTIFGEFTAGFTGEPTIEDAMAIVLAALSMLALGIFGPGIANGIVSGGPQLGAGAAVGAGLAAGGLAVGGVAGARMAVGAAGAGARGAAAVAGGLDRPAWETLPLAAAAGVAAGLTSVGKAGVGAAANPLRRSMSESYAQVRAQPSERPAASSAIAPSPPRRRTTEPGRAA